MAKVLTQRNIRHTNSADLDRQALDVTALRNGGVGVAFGGANRAGSGVTHTGFLDLATGRLGALTRLLYPGNASGGVPVTTVRSIDAVRAVGNDMVLTVHLANSAIGNDGNCPLDPGL